MICPVCESINVMPIDSYTSDGYTCHQCKECDIVFVDQMKGGDQNWYESSEWYEIDIGVQPKLKWYENQFLGETFDWNSHHVLNIGCGKTGFLRHLQDKGANVTGVDINPEMISFTKDVLGIEKVFHSDIKAFINGFSGGKFQAIVLFEVLEHLDNPGECLKLLKKILAPDGVIVFSVPNRNRIFPATSIWDYPPHHLTRWNVKSIENALNVHAYRAQRILISPVIADDFMRVMKIYFGTLFLEKMIRRNNTTRFIKVLYFLLIKFRVLFYKIIAFLLRPFLNGSGHNIYVCARNSDL